MMLSVTQISVIENYYFQDYGDIPDELYVDPNEPDVDDNQIEFIFDEDEDSEAEEMFDDSFSIKSTQRPKLRCVENL